MLKSISKKMPDALLAVLVAFCVIQFHGNDVKIVLIGFRPVYADTGPSNEASASGVVDLDHAASNSKYV